MKILVYRGLDTSAIPGYAKFAAFIEADDFRSADVKKVGENLYRGRLDRTERLLFSLYRSGGERFALVLEHIHAHAYEKSRFLSRGAAVDESRIPAVEAVEGEHAPQLPYVNPRLPRFHLLDKVLSFDDEQEAVYRQAPPLIVIGSAGSGKTALTLEKMKDVPGDILYVTRSPFLVQNARNLYYAQGYANEAQEIDFLSYREYLESIHVPKGREITPRAFAAWAGRQRLSRELRDAHRLFEEFQGAITGAEVEQPCLTRDQYLALGVRQSIYPPELRAQVYDLFERYLRFLAAEGWFDPNRVSHDWLARVAPRYDFVVVDEVQDLTNVQLLLILKSLRDPRRFLLCGDSNQIVHPNFFSWAKVKTLFWSRQGEETPEQLTRILSSNFRNSPEVTELANRLLRVKQARFGSVDRESSYLVRSCGPAQGGVSLLESSDAVMADLDRRTAASTRFAVLVLHPEQKAEAKRHFRTPLVFSIQEAKGLEYENVLLYDFLSGEERRFRDIAGDLAASDLEGELRYGRARDKGDKSLEVYKFYVNALYVAVTRAVKNLYLIESRPRHPLLALLGLTRTRQSVDLEEQRSSLEDWRREAHRLELQGKDEQAEEIRRQILKEQTVPWEVLEDEALERLSSKALDQADRKARVLLLEYALVHHDQRRINALAAAGFGAAQHADKGLATLEKKHYLPYTLKHPGAVLREVERYGSDFRNCFGQTPLMIASRVGNADLVERLVDLGADTSLVDPNGLNAFQIALDRACAEPRYARSRLAGVWDRLAPPSLSVQVDGRLVKLDSHLMEYLMLSLAMVLFYQRLADNWANRGALLGAGDFAEVLAAFPEALVPNRRKQKTYISSILSKNERSREGPYNRKLFHRVRRGQYLFNPDLAIRVGEDWRPIHELLEQGRLAAPYEDPEPYRKFGIDVNVNRERNMTHLRRLLEELATPQPEPVPPPEAPAPAPAEPPIAASAPKTKPPNTGKKPAQAQEEPPPDQLGFNFDD